jgi:hypothetical protein
VLAPELDPPPLLLDELPLEDLPPDELPPDELLLLEDFAPDELLLVEDPPPDELLLDELLALPPASCLEPSNGTVLHAAAPHRTTTTLIWASPLWRILIYSFDPRSERPTRDVRTTGAAVLVPRGPCTGS